MPQPLSISVRISNPSIIFHKRIVPSYPAEYRCLPSLEKLTALTGPSWPTIELINLPVTVSQIFIEWSQPALANFLCH